MMTLNKAHNKFNCMNCYANYGSLFQWMLIEIVPIQKMAALRLNLCLSHSHFPLHIFVSYPLSNLTDISSSCVLPCLVLACITLGEQLSEWTNVVFCHCLWDSVSVSCFAHFTIPRIQIPSRNYYSNNRMIIWMAIRPFMLMFYVCNLWMCVCAVHMLQTSDTKSHCFNYWTCFTMPKRKYALMDGPVCAIYNACACVRACVRLIFYVFTLHLHCIWNEIPSYDLCHMCLCV